MKRFLPPFVLLVFFSCLTEEGADPGKGSTFVRYFNGGFDDFAQTFKQTPDNGFIILATTQLTDLNATVQRSKIKLIKTDQYGNTEWQSLYTDFATTETQYYRCRDLFVEKDGAGSVTGYTIVGDSLNTTTGLSYLFIIQTNANGEFQRDGFGFNFGTGVRGQSITKDNNGDYLVLASRFSSVINGDDDMLLVKLDKNTFNPVWSHWYGSGQATSMYNLLVDQNNNIYWGRSVKSNSGLSDIRLVRTIPDSEATQFDHSISEAGFNEEGGAYCLFGPDPKFAFVGTTDQTENGNKDILYKQLSVSGNPPTVVQSKIIGESTNTIPEEGNAITALSDGGLLIIGTSGADEARDYYLIKINSFGDVLWSKIFGSKNADRGVGVLQASDGGLVILGQTTLGGLGGIMLMKTDKNGNIE